MTPEHASGIVARWVRLYTRSLPGPIAGRRVEEIGADVLDNIEFDLARGASPRRVSLSVLSRMVRGMPSDLSWRREARVSEGDLVKPFVIILAVALGVAAVAFVADSPAILLLSIAMMSVAVVGVSVHALKIARRGDFVVPFVAVLSAALLVAAIGVTSIVVGERADAPGLVLLGIVLIVSVIVGAYTFGMTAAQRSR
jgi:hypothetical protein